ncbi:MAG: ethylbenzene dehydrogenase-related protein [Gemmatimonadales bacterium]
MVTILRHPALIANTILAGFLVTACTGDGTTAPSDAASFLAVNQILTQDCGSCHDAGSGRFFLTTMDSTALHESGLVDPATPSNSLLILKAANLTPHGGGLIPSFTPARQAIVTTWIGSLPPVTGLILEAIRTGPGTQTMPPAIDGLFDAVWNTTPAVSLRVTGGFGEAEFVSVKAAYDDTYLYMLIVWDDDKASARRQPWIKRSDGTWATLPAKSALPTNGMSWIDYIKGYPNEEDPTTFAYEDKLSVIWNTYGASTVAGFDQAGCAVLCHDPSQGNLPGATYNLTTPELASKKYTKVAGEIADMWHWKYVRNNQHAKADDQYVRFWQPGPTGAASGGRASDPGDGGYGTNPALNGRPQFRGPSITAPPYYILDNQKIALTDGELAALPVGTEIANMITSGPTGTRADVDAKGLYNSGRWLVEIRRRLVTGDPFDVQFDDLTRAYAFGVAIFDNAQIEHRYQPVVASLRFKP